MLSFKLSEQNRNNIVILLRDAEIKGSDASKVVKIVDAISKKTETDIYELDKELAAFILGTLNDIKIQGKFASAVVSIQLALANPIDQGKTPETDKVQTKSQTRFKK